MKREAVKDIPEARRSTLAGALGIGRAHDAAREETPGGAAPGRVVHCKREAFEVYIGRPSRFGNPHNLKGLGGDRQRAIELFEQTARQRIEVDAAWREAVEGLYGKVLGCWCAPKPCHGDVLLKLAAELHSTSTGAKNG